MRSLLIITLSLPSLLTLPIGSVSAQAEDTPGEPEPESDAAAAGGGEAEDEPASETPTEATGGWEPGAEEPTPEARGDTAGADGEGNEDTIVIASPEAGEPEPSASYIDGQAERLDDIGRSATFAPANGGPALPQTTVAFEQGSAESRVTGSIAFRQDASALTITLRSERTDDGDAGDVFNIDGGLLEGASVGLRYTWNGLFHTNDTRDFDRRLSCLCAAQGGLFLANEVLGTPEEVREFNTDCAQRMSGHRWSAGGEADPQAGGVPWSNRAPAAEGNRVCGTSELYESNRALLGSVPVEPFIFTVGGSVMYRQVDWLDLSQSTPMGRTSGQMGGSFDAGFAWLPWQNVGLWLYVNTSLDLAITGARRKVQVCTDLPSGGMSTTPSMLQCSDRYLEPLALNTRWTVPAGLRTFLGQHFGLAFEVAARLFDASADQERGSRVQMELPLYFLPGGGDEGRLTIGLRPRLVISDQAMTGYEAEAQISAFVGGSFQAIPL